jgi:hypothetical protein
MSAIGSYQDRANEKFAMTRAHPPDQTAFRAILSENIDWKPFAAFPPPAIGPLGMEYVDPNDDPRNH